MVADFIDSCAYAFAFIGFIFLLIYIVLILLKPDSFCKCVIYLNDDISKEEMNGILSGIIFKSLIYGDSVFENTIIVNAIESKSLADYFKSISESVDKINIITLEEFNDFF